jgi:outer membrane protein OmpA-like peptidoglycan-associated protein
VRRAAAAIVLGALVAPAAAVAQDGLQVRIDDLQVTIRDQHTRIETTQTRTERSVTVPSDVLFAFDSARLTSAGRRALRSVALDLPGDRLIRVTGHTDARGSAAYNRALSLRRARAVAAVLPSPRVAIVAAGEAQPVASNENAAGRARNRRVEIQVGGAPRRRG